MPLYVAERQMPGLTMAELETMQKNMIEGSQHFRAEGKSVRYLRSVFVPSESYCLSLFEAENAGVVRDIHEARQIPFTRILEAVDLTP